ncbi:MAG: S1 family peptidase [Solirubrobacteraceae bacterium]
MALSGVVLVLLATIATGAPVTTRGALAARNPTAVSRHGQRRNVHEVAGPFRKSIVGGQTAPAGSFPWLAFIEDNLGGGNYALCTGTVVSSNVVLTAGHCAEDITTGAQRPASGFAVVTGTLDWTDAATRQVSSVSQAAIYPGFDPNPLHGDAAVLELSTPTTAPAIPLATTSSFLVPGARAAMAGWGLTDSSSSASMPDQLQWAATVVQRPTYCAAHDGLPFDSSAQFCSIDAPYDDNSFCHGDSGGPLIANYLSGQSGPATEIGVISNVAAGCPTSAPDVFTRADSISTWVNAQIASDAPQSPSASPTASTPPPAVQTPTAVPPAAVTTGRMLPNEAKSDARQVLSHVLGRRFTNGHQLAYNCSRVSTNKFDCAPQWWFGDVNANDYYGDVTVWLLVQNGQVEWSDHYAIHWVNDWCYWHSGHRSRCRIWTKRGAW